MEQWTKIGLGKAIASQSEYIKDLIEQIENQCPQPNGSIWLHGEVITRMRYSRAKRDLAEMVGMYNALGKKQLELPTFPDLHTLINKFTKTSLGILGLKKDKPQPITWIFVESPSMFG